MKFRYREADVLLAQDLRDMDNAILKKKVKNNRLTGIMYSITLIPLLIIAMNISFKYTVSTFFFYIIIIGAFIIHFILYLFASLLFSSLRARPFIKEFNTITRKYEETDDAAVLLSYLSKMKHNPKDQDSINAFNLSMSTALYRNNRSEEALTYLNAINTSDEALLKAVKEQRDTFEGKVAAKETI